jgi:hypothetical protein
MKYRLGGVHIRPLDEPIEDIFEPHSQLARLGQRIGAEG